MLVRFARDESGSTAIEYALVASLIAMAIIVALTMLSNATQETYERISSAVQDASQNGGNS